MKKYRYYLWAIPGMIIFILAITGLAWIENFFKT